MNRFQGFETPLAGVWRIERSLIADARGFLGRLFCAEELSAYGWIWPIAQINHALTEKSGTVRGMHFQQPPHAEAKLVSCVKGSVWDVVIDLRRDSLTYMRWTAHVISAINQCALLIPPGCAHGFQSLEDRSELLYCHSHPYVADADAALNPQDPTLASPWPQTITLISDKDRQRPLLNKTFQGLII